MCSDLIEAQAPPLHLIKLCVGVDDLESLRQGQEKWMARRRASGADTRPRHITRMWPRRADEILAGGSLYWVIKGVIRARQRIAAFDEIIQDDGIRRCAIILDPAIVPTMAQPRRPFQGWRYLRSGDAPADLTGDRVEMDMPADLAAVLESLGVRG